MRTNKVFPFAVLMVLAGKKKKDIKTQLEIIWAHSSDEALGEVTRQMVSDKEQILSCSIKSVVPQQLSQFEGMHADMGDEAVASVKHASNNKRGEFLSPAHARALCSWIENAEDEVRRSGEVIQNLTDIKNHLEQTVTVHDSKCEALEGARDKALKEAEELRKQFAHAELLAKDLADNDTNMDAVRDALHLAKKEKEEIKEEPDVIGYGINVFPPDKMDSELKDGKYPDPAFDMCWRCHAPYACDHGFDGDVLIGRIGICEECMTSPDWDKYHDMEFYDPYGDILHDVQPEVVPVDNKPTSIDGTRELVTINGAKNAVPVIMTYAELVVRAELPPNDQYTCTYRCPVSADSGTLLPGGSLEMTKGMVINIVET